ncbi:MAG: DUF1501 domain-containing protein [Planctomycetota bacterium]|nr:DUF1501 domain-containing protein [Planctomycetota bacterium]
MNTPASTNSLIGPSRRNFLHLSGGGFGLLGLGNLLASEGPSSTETVQRRTNSGGHHAAAAKQVIQVFCTGAMSHLDTFDYKPELEKRAGKPFDPSGELQFFASKPGNCQPSYWSFRQHGESGRWISDLLPNLADCVDDMAFIYSMQNKSALHGPATFMMNTGFIRPDFPTMGAWVTYGLGSENNNLPSYVVIPDARGVPPGGPLTWGAGFLPAMHQGTKMNVAKGRPAIDHLFPKSSLRPSISDERASRDLVQWLNGRHHEAHAEDTELAARIEAFELAARLQLSAPDVTDLSLETRATEELYGLHDPAIEPFGRQCLMARRLVERGVRFVQVFCGADNVPPPRPNWDAHEDLKVNHGKHGPVYDRGVAALIKDLKQRGLLDETLVIGTTEFGRQPAAQGKGRDHNPGAYTTWLAGGGIRGGASYGTSDELGFQAEENPCYSYDLHATCLHLLGLNHERLTYYHNGIERRLTDVHGHVINDLIA